ncbi:MAG: hypothetical protein JJT75_11285 [Opitutales bacterium]|nr:hypothetical protein [Opitutales bacterium]MCH8540894.1 hypothetical protein [Opitutales bacterium]
MKKLSLLCLSALFVFTAVSHSQQDSQRVPIEVERVNWNSVRDGNRGNWQEVEIQLDVKGYNEEQQRALELHTPTFLSDIEIVLHTAYELRSPQGSAIRDEQDNPIYVFYSSEVEIVALERNARNNRVLFYLPPEIVKRDGIRAGQEPFRFLVELRADGREIPFSRESQRRMSRDLMNPEAVSNFMSQVRSHASANEGSLMPIYQTPHWHSRRADDSPPYRW